MELFKEINGKSKKRLTPEQQEDPTIMLSILSTKCIKASNKEITKAKEYFNKNKKCKFHLIYDKPGFMYSERICGICKYSIALI